MRAGTAVEELEVELRDLRTRLATAEDRLEAKEDQLLKSQHDAGAVRSQLDRAEAVIAERDEDVTQLTSQLQVCILQLKSLSEASRAAHSHQRRAFDGIFGDMAKGAQARTPSSPSPQARAPRADKGVSPTVESPSSPPPQRGDDLAAPSSTSPLAKGSPGPGARPVPGRNVLPKCSPPGLGLSLGLAYSQENTL